MSEDRGAMAERHRAEWEGFRAKAFGEVLMAPMDAEEKSVKTLKVVAETLRIAQEGERRAMDYGLELEADPSPFRFAWDDGGGDADDPDSV